MRDEALRTIERSVNRGALTSRAADRMDGALQRDGDLGIDAAYIAAVGDPAYERAFAKLKQHGALAPMRMTTEEQQAVQRVTRAESVRAMLEGTGSAGGFESRSRSIRRSRSLARAH